MGLARQEYGSALSFPSQEDLPVPAIEPTSLALAGEFFTTEPPGKPLMCIAAAKLLQLCPTLCDPIDGSPPGSPVPGILQARTLERVAISFSNAWKWKVKVKSLSHVRLFATPWTAAYRAPPWIFQARVLEWGAIAFSVMYINPPPKYALLWILFAKQVNLYE